MSRLEDALDKALGLRESKTVSPLREMEFSSPPPLPLHTIELRNPLLIPANAPNTPIAEEYRKLKSAVVHLTKGENPRNLLMITSSESAEGKSLTALNLAMTLALEHDHTVLLIDADLRKPSLHKYLQVEPAAGLSECLLEGIDLQKVLVKTGFGKLTLLPAGKEVRTPSELFSSQRTRAFFTSIKKRYPDRYIIVDTPPILSFAETLTIGNIVDAVIVVVKEGKTKIKALNETLDYLKHTSILGIVYNGVTENFIVETSHYYR